MWIILEFIISLFINTVWINALEANVWLVNKYDEVWEKETLYYLRIVYSAYESTRPVNKYFQNVQQYGQL